MTSAQARIELERLHLIHEAHGTVADLHRALLRCEGLLLDDRDSEAEQIARDTWAACEQLRGAALRLHDEDGLAAELLADIEVAQDSAKVWLGIIETIPAGWKAWKRAGGTVEQLEAQLGINPEASQKREGIS